MDRETCGEEIKPYEVLDCKGDTCPMPVLKDQEDTQQDGSRVDTSL
jgi:hypothetical protein